MVTFAAAAGDPDVKEKCLTGTYKSGDKTFHVHLDGYNLLPTFKDPPKDSNEWPRREFVYWNGGLDDNRVGHLNLHGCCASG
jgi:hypothetical protein